MSRGKWPKRYAKGSLEDAIYAALKVEASGKAKRRNSRESRAHRLEHLHRGNPMEEVASVQHQLRLIATVVELVAARIQEDFSPEEAATILRDAAKDLRRLIG